MDDQLLFSDLKLVTEFNSNSLSHKLVCINSILPNNMKSHYFPVIFIADEDAKLFIQRKITKKQLIKMYKVEDNILIGKACLINCLESNTPIWEKANYILESIMDIGNSISDSKSTQTPALYPIGDEKFNRLTEHKYLYALIFAYGYNSSVKFNLYKAKQLKKATYGKLIALKK